MSLGLQESLQAAGERIRQPAFWRNVAAVIGLPLAGTYAVSRALAKRTGKADEKFERQIDEFVKAESPVINLDPHIDDTEKEDKLRKLGVRKQSATKSLHPWETGTLLALAYLSGLYGWRAGTKSALPEKIQAKEAEHKRLLNELEAAEHERLFQQSDPEGWMQSRGLKKATPEVTLPMDKAIDALLAGPIGQRVVLKKAVPLLGLLGGGAKIGAVLAAMTAAAGIPAWWTYKRSKEAVQSGAKWAGLGYVPLAASLLVGSYAAGRQFGNKTDVNRSRLKVLREALEADLEANRSPAILEVGSDLPWEKARTMPPEKLASGKMPEDAEKRLARERREIRI